MKDAKLTKEQQELADLQAQKDQDARDLICIDLGIPIGASQEMIDFVVKSREENQAEIERLKKQSQAPQNIPASIQPQEPIVPIAKKSTFPGNIIVLKMMRNEHKHPTGYEEIEVPEELAHSQLALPVAQRSPSYRDICYVHDANPSFLK